MAGDDGDGKGKTGQPRNGSAKKRRMRRYALWAGPIILVVLGLLGIAYANYKFFREEPQIACGDVEEANKKALCASDAEEWFKYGSLGSESDRGVPYPIFHVLPRVFGDLLPGPGGYRSLGIPWEEGRELPVGFSKKTLGFPRITQNCAVCHTATYRISADAKPVIVPTGPSHTTNVQAFLDFLQAAANDSRFSADVMMPAIEQSFDLGFDDKLIYRFLIIPFARQAILDQASQFDWMRAHGRPDWGPGRDDPMNLTKFFMIEMEDDGTTGNADFPSIWNMGVREGQSLNWAGETQDPLAVFMDSALGLGAPPGPAFVAQMKELRAYLRSKAPPPFPADAGPAYAINEEWAAGGKLIFDEYCGECHGWDGAYLGKVIPITEIGTDRERFDTWSQEHADATNAVAKEMGVERKDMVKDVGYASQPLDGIWLRAPYLHNGSVPTLRDLLNPPAQRPKVFYRGCDLYDPANMGFVSSGPSDDCPRTFEFRTTDRGNGNGGHVYGTMLTPDEKNWLLEYMKTL
jgi:mono/diheme cytochrome c family protein